MSTNSQRIFRSRGTDLLARALRRYEGRPAKALGDAAAFSEIAEGLWSELPAPIRFLGKDKLQWDSIVARIRDKVLADRNGRIYLPPNYKSLISEILERLGDAADRTSMATMQSVRPASSTVIGIDLGTTYSVAAYVDQHGRPQSLQTPSGESIKASVIFIDADNNVLVGREAIKAAAVEPSRSAECVKRDMGSRSFRRRVAGEWMPPEVLASMILRSLKHDAERVLGRVDQAVVTVPAYFDEPKRRATMDAGRLAGLEILDILNEPTAAAIAYGYEQNHLQNHHAQSKPLHLLVYDLGGGTFDVSIVQISGGEFRTIATDGDFGLGGKDWDEQLADLAAAKFQSRFGFNPRSNPVSEHELLREAEEAKRSLSERGRCLLLVSHAGGKLQVEVTRQEFEDATAGLLRRTRITTELLMRQARMQFAELDRVVLVGGSTRMPMVRRMLEELTGLPIDQSLSPEHAVAHGAALYADRLRARSASGAGKTHFGITNVNAHSLGIKGIDPKRNRHRNRILIKKNTPLPAEVTKRFRTYKDGQRSVSIVILEGESKDPDACTRVGKVTLGRLPPNLPAGWPVHITYRYAENGRLEVTAKLQGRLAECTTTFVRDNSLPEGDLLLWAEYVEESTSYLEI